MKTPSRLGQLVAVWVLTATGVLWAAELAYESLNSGGISYATNGQVKLGGSLGQAGLIGVATNGHEVQGGFWKLENGCELHPVAITDIMPITGHVAITFNAMLSNVYSVVSIATEQGGPGVDPARWTNLAATVTGLGGVGSVTTVYENVSALTNRARFYLIRCEAP